MGSCELDIKGLPELYYDPYTLTSFINKETGERVDKVDAVYFHDGRAYIVN